MCRASPCLVFGILFLAVAVLALYFALPPPPDFFGPINPIVDVGDIDQNQAADVVFDLVNLTRSKMTILDTWESCACSKATVSPSTFEPGETGKLKAKWYVGSARGSKKIAIKVIYVSEGDKRESFDLFATANVLPDIEVTPPTLSFSRVGGAQEQSVTLSPGRAKSFELLEARCSHRAFSCTLFPLTKTVCVEFDPNRWEDDGRLQPYLLLKTSSKAEPNIHVDLHVAN